MATAPRHRVVVLGNSVSVLCRPHAPATYAGTLSDVCRARGVDVDVWNQGRWFEQVDSARRRWDRDVSPFLPAAVVVNYGAAECQPWVLPHVLHRALLDWKSRTTVLSAVGRALLIRPGRALLRRATTPVARVAGQRGHKMRPSRFRDEVSRLVRVSRSEIGAAVLVLGVSPPGPQLERFIPGFERRTARYDAILREVVDAFDDELVSFVDVRELHVRLGSEMSQDGLHYTPAGHRAVAEVLAERLSTLLCGEASGSGR